MNKDVLVAAAMLFFCMTMWAASLSIVAPDFGMLPPTAWPRIILTALTGLSAIYFIRSFGHATNADVKERQSIGQQVASYRNPLLCFALYFLFLWTLPVLGVPLGGSLLVFMLLNVLGGIKARTLVLHALIAVCSVGILFSVFTFALNVRLPAGTVLPSIF